MKELEYPFSAEELIRKKKKLRRQLLEETDAGRIKARVAILGGQTTQTIRQMLELFLLNQGIEPSFYESEYNQYYEDGFFDNPELVSFRPDVIWICTCIRNVRQYPCVADSEEAVAQKRKTEIDRFAALWSHLAEKYNCQIIQNNFELPDVRLMGNRDGWDIHGRVCYIRELNGMIGEYARKHERFHVLDVQWLSAVYGLDRWSDPYYWHMYKYAVAVPAIPYLSFQAANLIKSIYGRNKKAFNLDLDNTLWGGVIGDDGADNIEIGQETSVAQTYSEFQRYLKEHQQLGVLLTVNSKNDEQNALSGFLRPDSVLKREDFASFKANWDSKDRNLSETARELNLLPESFVFVDDNPAERAIIEAQHPGTAVPRLGEPEHYMRQIDRGGYFEVTTLSQDDLRRSEMYLQNAQREQVRLSFTNYEDYLKSLQMKGEIRPFAPLYVSRIAQLTNKSNQFNLTTRRYTQSDIEALSKDPDYVTLYGRLEDRFGDNGVVSVVIGRIMGEDRSELHMELWLMSCRVLKREMEFAMMDALAERARKLGIRKLVGYYYPTAKNGMVKDFYQLQGFTKVQEDEAGNTVWEFVIDDRYQKKQHVIDLS